MLASLTIKNIVLIDHLVIDFKNQLCALTGETGAGKSILLDSLGLGLGARADAGLVRKGEDQASVSAMFEIKGDHAVLAFLKNQDLDGDTTLILRRTLTKDGRSKAYINDQPVSAGLLKQAGEMLVEIHGQFDTQSLLNPIHHIDLLDEYAGNHDQLRIVKNVWDEWKATLLELQAARDKIDQAREDEEYFRTSLEDLDALSPETGEEEKLSTLRDQLMRKEQILENITNAKQAIIDMESAATTIWKALDKLDEEGEDIVTSMNGVNAEIQEVVSGLDALTYNVENSEHSLTDIDDRLFALKAQARKHGCSIDELAAKREEIAASLNAIENQDGMLADLIRQSEVLKNKYMSEAEKLSTVRQKLAEKLSVLIMEELPPLKLDKARFKVEVSPQEEDQWNAKGMDQVRFLVATNPGAELGALNKIASGGEMARLMLALKVVLAEVGVAGTLIFDEVDSGIGGATAAAVGERLARLADFRQILVVTHSPQVAAMAGHQWIVTKGGDKDVTTTIIPLNDVAERQEEIARMLSGAEITPEARAAANKLLESSTGQNKKVA